MAKKYYAQTTKGYYGEFLIAKAGVEYNQATSVATFLSGAEGSVAVFDVATGLPLVITATVPAAMVAGKSYYVAVLRDGKMAKTQPFVFNPADNRKIDYQAPVKQVTSLAITDHTPTVDTAYTVKVLDPSATLGNQPIPVYQYSVTAKPAETLDALMARLAAEINDVNNITHKDDGQVVTAVYTAGTNVLALTAVEFGTYFDVAVSGELAGRAALTETTAVVLGNGTYEQVAQLEQEGWIDEGYETNYPVIGSPAEWGLPSVFATPAMTYSFIAVEQVRQRNSVANTVTQRPTHILLAIPSTGTTPLNELLAAFVL